MYCDNPQRVYNKYLKRWVLVPCNHCQSCLITKSNALSARVSTECEKHPYNIWFTLTYDNEHVPFITPDKCEVQSLDGRISLDDYDDRIYESIEYITENSDLFIPGNPKYRPLTNHPIKKSVGVLWKKDIQRFVKRCRIHLYRHLLTQYEQIYEKEIAKKKASQCGRFSIFICGEFGTNDKRPHYHGIFHFDDLECAEFVRQDILSCWSFCDWDLFKRLEQTDGKKRLPQYVQSGGAASYVSSYVTVFSTFDDALEKSYFHTFTTFSKRPLYGVSKVDEEILQEFVNGNFDTEINREIERCSSDGLSSSNHVFSAHFLRSLFPRFDGIDKMSDSDLLQLCINDCPENPQRHSFFTKCRTFCIKYFKKWNLRTIQQYLLIYARLVARVKSYLIRDFMLSYIPESPIEYLKSAYHTGEDSPKFDMFLWRVIKFCFGIDILLTPLPIDDYGCQYRSDLALRKKKYWAKLMPKHSNQLNF